MGANDDIRLLLSAYRDGELSPAERARVEKALASEPKLATRLADLDALSGAVRQSLEQAADEVDFRGFAARVAAKTTPHKPPLWERMRVATAELFEYRRWQLAAGVAAAAVVAVGGPVLFARATLGGGTPGVATGPSLRGPAIASVTVRSVSTPDDRETLLFKPDSGTTVIYVRNR